jgi:hypothetical protein
MSIALVQSTVNTVSVASLAYGSNNTAGNLLICKVVNAGGTQSATPPTDTQSNTWVKAFKGNIYALFYVQNCKAGANTVTIASGTAQYQSFSLYEFSGIATSGALDQVSSASTSSWSNASSRITPTLNGELVFAMADQTGSSGYLSTTVGASWTAAQTIQFTDSFPFYYTDQDGWLIQAAAATIGISTPSAWSSSGSQGGCLLASFFAAAGASGPKNLLQMMGCGN